MTMFDHTIFTIVVQLIAYVNFITDIFNVYLVIRLPLRSLRDNQIMNKRSYEKYDNIKILFNLI